MELDVLLSGLGLAVGGGGVCMQFVWSGRGVCLLMWIEWEVSGVCVCGVSVVQCVAWEVCMREIRGEILFESHNTPLSLPRVFSVILYNNLFDSHLLQSGLLKC